MYIYREREGERERGGALFGYPDDCLHPLQMSLRRHGGIRRLIDSLHRAMSGEGYRFSPRASRHACLCTHKRARGREIVT